MNKAVKMTMIGIGIAVAVVAVALIYFVATFDLNDYKERIAQAVEDETGRTLHFGGDLNLSLFPTLGVELGPMQLSNRPGFDKAPMAQVVSALVEVRLLPLLRGEIRFGHLELDQPLLRLSRKQDGTTNWDDLVGHAEEQEAREDKPTDDSKFSIEIAGLSIKGATLYWDDDLQGAKYTLNHVDLETGRIEEVSPFPVEARLDFECSNPGAKGSISMTGTSSLDLANRVYSHLDTRITMTAQGAAIPGGTAEGSLAWKLFVLDFTKEHAQITGLTATTYGATVHLDGTLDGLTDGLKKAAGTCVVDPFDMRKTLTAMGMAALETGDPNALTSVGGNTEFSFMPGQIKVKSLTVNLDGATITGKGSIKRAEDDPFYFARLEADTLDLDKYLPAEHAQKVEKTKKAKASEGKTTNIIPPAFLRRLYIDSEAKLGQLKVGGARFSNVKAELNARHGLVRLSPVSAESYGGTISAGATINAMRKYPKTDLIVGIKNLDVGGLSKDMEGGEEYGGIANLNAALACDGEHLDMMLRTLNGKVSFNLKNGIFPGVDLMRMAKETHAKKNDTDGKVTASDEDSTRFGSIAGTGVIKNGVLRNRDLEVKAPGYRADGEGAIVLPTRQIDYLVKVKLTPLADGQDGKSSSDLYGVMVPIRVSGTLEDPHYWVSISEYIKALGGAVIGTAGAVIGGVKDAIKGVGSAITGTLGDSKEAPEKEQPTKRKKFLGIF